MAYEGEGKNIALSSQVDEVEVTPGYESQKLGTQSDQRGMVRMGRKQEIAPPFRFHEYHGLRHYLGLLMGIRNDVRNASS